MLSVEKPILFEAKESVPGENGRLVGFYSSSYLPT